MTSHHVTPHFQSTNSLDVHVLVDVIAECMGSEQSELANIGEKAIRLVTETCKYILGEIFYLISPFSN